MRTITTDKGKTYPVEYAWAPLGDGSCGICLSDDSRLLSVIAEEFEGVENIHLVDQNVGESDFSGYTVLQQIGRTGKMVQMKLTKGV